MACKALQKKTQYISLLKHHLRNKLTSQSTASCAPFQKKPVHSTSHQDPLDKADRSLYAGICFYSFQASLRVKKGCLFSNT